MIERLQAYPEYKDSCVPWFGGVPEHWEVLPNRAIFTEVKERDRPNEQMLSVTITKGVIPQQALLAASSKKDSSNQDKTAYKLVQPGDLAYNKMRAWQGAIGASRYRGIISPAYVVQRPKRGVDSRYLHYLLRTPAFAKEAERWSYGITSDMWSLRPEHFKMIYCCLPPLPEQTAIVRFLVHADLRIRQYIRVKQKLIKLLEEQKQAIIHSAVTRGLDPNVRLKPSGIQWLGDIPAHWEVAALRHRYSQCLGKMLDSKRITGEYSIPYFRNTDVQWDRINIEDLPTMDIRPIEYERYTVQKGDLLVCEGGEVGRCAIWSGNQGVYGYQKALHRLRPLDSSQDMPRYMYYALRTAAKNNAFNDGHVSTIEHLTGDKLRAHRFPFPPIIEQQALVNFLDSESEKTNLAISMTHSEISFLREYRMRLITDVVTGKIDVREVAAKLTDEVEETDNVVEADEVAEDSIEEDSEALAAEAEEVA